MGTSNTIAGPSERVPAGRKSGWPARGKIMSYKSVASRKRAAAARLRGRASVLLAEAADFDSRADELLKADERQ